MEKLSIADRATIANMCPEYGATIGFFPVDMKTLDYLRQTSRDEAKIKMIEAYLRAVGMLRDYTNTTEDPVFSEIHELDLSNVVPSLSGPKRPHDRVAVSDMKQDFLNCLTSPVGFKGFGMPSDKMSTTVPFMFDGQQYTLNHGSVLIAAITSCTNTSNPSVMLGAGMLAQRAVEKGLTVAPYIKTSLSPGSGVVTYYLEESGVIPHLEALGFGVVGYGCMTCIGNSGPLPEPVVEAVDKGDLVCCGVLSGNRNFEGRIHPNTRANYLASPLFVIAYAIAGRVDIDFEKEPLAHVNGQDVFLRDIWPSRAEIQAVETKYVIPAMFKEVYGKISTGNANWNKLEAPAGTLYPWDVTSTYIKHPPFFTGMYPYIYVYFFLSLWSEYRYSVFLQNMYSFPPIKIQFYLEYHRLFFNFFSLSLFFCIRHSSFKKSSYFLSSEYTMKIIQDFLDIKYVFRHFHKYTYIT